MDKERRKELLAQYKEIKTFMGIVRITNKTNGKCYLGSCSNLKNRWLSLKDQLNTGRFVNSGLQQDWKELGEDAFVYDVVEQKEVEEDMNVKWELEAMEKEWLEKLQPFEEKGYNKRPRQL